MRLKWMKNKKKEIDRTTSKERGLMPLFFLFFFSGYNNKL